LKKRGVMIYPKELIKEYKELRKSNFTHSQAIDFLSEKYDIDKNNIIVTLEIYEITKKYNAY